MYASINLAGTFNDWNPTNLPMKRSNGLTWERRVHFDHLASGEFKVSANDAGVVYWGSEYEPVAGLPYRATLRRLGSNIKIATPLDGDFLVRFDEESTELSIEPVAAEPKPAAQEEPPLRAWTDVRGQRVEARLIAVDGDAVTLERENGQRLRVRLTNLSAADRDYARRHTP